MRYTGTQSVQVLWLTIESTLTFNDSHQTTSIGYTQLHELVWSMFATSSLQVLIMECSLKTANQFKPGEVIRLYSGNLQHADDVISCWIFIFITARRWTLDVPVRILPCWRRAQVSIATTRRQPLPAHCACRLYEVVNFRWRHVGEARKSKCRSDVTADCTRRLCLWHYVIRTLYNSAQTAEYVVQTSLEVKKSGDSRQCWRSLHSEMHPVWSTKPNIAICWQRLNYEITMWSRARREQLLIV